MGRNANKEGSTRKLPDGSWECVIQSKYLNPKTGKPKRFKRKAKSADEAVKIAKMNMRAWEKEFERGRDTKVAKSKTFGSYMEEFIDNELKPTLTGVDLQLKLNSD